MAAPIGVKNGRLALFHKHAPVSADATPSRTEVLHGGMRETLLPVGAALLQAAGVAPHDAFVLVVDNDRASVACMLAAMELKCVCVLVGKSRVALVPHVLQQTGLSKIITVESSGELTVSGEERGPTQTTWVDEDALQGGGVGMLTSGSVGEPKVVMCSWERMLLQGQSTHEQLFPDRPARIICGTSISHAYSINAIFTLLTSPHDTKSELCFASDTQALSELLSERSEKLTVLYGTPATYTRLLELPAKPLYADIAFSAGTKLSRELFDLTLEHNGLRIMQNYGSTETGDIAAWNLLGSGFEEESKLMENGVRAFVGSLWPGVRVQVTPEGEVLVWTPWQSMGYVIDGNLYLTGGAPHRTADRGIVLVKSETITQLWLEGRIRLPMTLKLGPKRQLFEVHVVEQLFKSKTDITDVLALMQDPSAPHTSMRVRVVLRDESKMTVKDLQSWATVELGIPTTALEVELVDFLPCSPAGKLMYR